MFRNRRITILFFVPIIILSVLTLHNKRNPTLSPQPKATFSSTSIIDSSRITKKPFGIYITLQNSPVQPEKFSGYHTGADFETTSDEADKDIAVPALCDGTLLVNRTASGYGGVAVESCTLKGQVVTVVYGHLKASSIVTIGTQLKKGDQIGILGKGYSSETDGERKHLHLGIHRGATINILGYVQKQPDLSGWLDPKEVIGF